MRMVVEPNRIPAAWMVGDLVSGPVTEFDPEVQASLREIEWRVRRTAGHWFQVKRSDVDRWETRPRWTAGVQSPLAEALRAAAGGRA